MLHVLLEGKKLVLASASPRRKEIFSMLGLKPLIVPADLHEPIDVRPARLITREHAINKARTVKHHFDSDTVIVAADTLVWVDKLSLGKPENEQVAADYLKLLSGKTHSVYSCICILYHSREAVALEKSLVTFAKLSDFEIEAYIRTREPFDKAGAYGIQGFGGQFITKVTGCYFNVMGFPVSLFYKKLKEML